MGPIDETRAWAGAVLDAVEEVIVGKRPVLELILLGSLARGHVLLEDVPGLAKTLMAKSFAQAVGIEFTGVQFTPISCPRTSPARRSTTSGRDGSSSGRGRCSRTSSSARRDQPAPPKTQAALLEAMQEEQVTVENATYRLPAPFIVMATQNLIEFEGTYPLPRRLARPVHAPAGSATPTATPNGTSCAGVWALVPTR